MTLAGAPIFGHLYAHKPGHRLNHALLREVFAHQNAWRRLPYEELMQRIDADESRLVAEG